MIDGGVVLRPRSSGASVDLGVALLRADLRLHARAYATPFVAAAAVSLVVHSLDPSAGVMTAMWLGRWIQAPITRIAGDRVAGQAPQGDPRQAIRTFFGPHVLASLSALVANLIPILGLVWWGRLVFVPEVSVLERATSPMARAGAVASQAAATGVVAIRLWLLAIEAFGAFGLAALLRFMADDLLQIGRGGEWYGPTLVIGVLLIQPVVATVRLAFYLDARTRSEALDAWFALWAAAGRDQ